MSNKKEVLFVVNHLTIGGAQKSLIEALRAIDYEQYDVTLYLRKKRLDLLSEIDSHVTVVVNEDTTAYYRQPSALWSAMRAKACRLLGNKSAASRIERSMEDRIRQKRLANEAKRYFAGKHYDVAVSYMQGYPAELIADHIEADRKILFYHSSTDEVHEVHERILPCYDTVVAVNQSVKDVLTQFYPAHTDKIRVLENYVNADVIHAAAQKNVPVLHPDQKRLCSCGRMSPVKGFDLAVEAARILKEKGVPFVWYFVGDGPERAKLESLAHAYGLDEDVVFAGMQTNPYPWMAGCDVYVQPSYEESFGLTIAEAKILCCPVVSTKTMGGIDQIIHERNGLVTEITPQGLADGIERMLCDGDLYAHVRATLEKVDHSRDFEAYRSLWASLLGGDGV